jgi:hypothetical protein
MTMAQAKTSLLPHAPAARGAANDNVFMPVPSRPRRINRASLWAFQAGVPDPDFSQLSRMRALERRNRG